MPKQSVSTLLLIVISTGIGLLLAEAGLRILGIGYGNVPLEASRYLHHVHPRNYDFLVYDPRGEYGGTRIYYDEKGYRVPGEGASPNRTGAKRIAFMGDSFTEGNQLPWAETFVGLIEEHNSDIVVRNFGVSSYSPVMYLVQLKSDVREFKPTDVVLQIFNNDFSDDDGYITTGNSKHLNELIALDGGSRSLSIYLLRYSYVARIVRRAQLQIAYAIKNTDSPTGTGEERASPNRIGDVTRGALEEIKRVCDESGIALHMLMIPNKQLVVSGSCCESDYEYIELRKLSEQLGIDFIDVAPLFSAYAKPDKLFFPVDIHLTAEGSKLIASAINAKLD